MTSKKSNGFKVEILPEMSGVLQKHYDTIIADGSIPDLDIILISIYLIEKANKKAGANYNETKDLFVSFGRKDVNFKVNIHNAKKKSLIKEENRNLHFLSGGLKRIRELLGQVEKAPVYVIKSGQNLSAIKLFEEFLISQFGGGEVLVCDPHISHSTLFPFIKLKGKIKALKILTTNVYDSAKFDDYKKKMSKELGIPIEIRKNQKIHDRFIIQHDKCWSIGSSIKDLGNKDSTVREISEVTSSLKDLFFERWYEDEKKD